MTARVLAGLSLAICVAAPFLFFWGRLGERGYENLLAAGSAAWFVFATIAMRAGKSDHR